jgi:hypothetical protein
VSLLDGWLATLDVLPAASSSVAKADSTSAAIKTIANPAMFVTERSLIVILHLLVCCDELPQITRQIGAISPG